MNKEMLKKTIEEYRELNTQKLKMEKDVKRLSEIIKKEIELSGKKDFSNENKLNWEFDNYKMSMTKVIQKEFNLDKLKSKVSNEVYNKVTSFKRVLDEDKLEKSLFNGLITPKEVGECFDIKKEYFKLNEIKDI
jgi:hypothetical protein